MICSSMLGFGEERWFSTHTHLKMSWRKYQTHKKNAVFDSQHPMLSSSSPPFRVTIHNTSPPSSSTGTKISPAVLFIIVILAVLFFISGLLHLLVRYLTKHYSSSNSSQSNRYPDGSTSDTLQRQLQQLFHLHDSGLDQAFIDALPVFMYKEVVAVGGAKEPFDCAVCLCEFREKDNLRLLPTCSHAFHIGCIDTWLLSNSTCPLCRNTLFNPGFTVENPVFEFDDEGGEGGGAAAGGGPKSIELEKGVVPVRLGKFRRLNQGESVEVGETSSSNLDARRCYSMGSYEYVVGDTSLKVTLNRETESKVGENQNQNRAFEEEMEGKKINIGAKTDSYSVSKIWLWSKKGKFASSSENQT